MEDLTKKLIGTRIYTALETANIKQKELAKELNVTDNTVSYWCNGTRTPNTEQIIQIARILNVSSDYLLGLSDVATTDAELKAVCEYTGLSDKAVTSIKELTTEEDKKYLMNFLLSDSSFCDMLYHFSMYLREYFYAVISLSSSIKSSEYCKILSKRELKTEENNLEKFHRNLLKIKETFESKEITTGDTLEKIYYHLEEHKKKAEEATSHIKDARYHLFETIESIKASAQKFNPFSEKYWGLLEDYYSTQIIDIDDIVDWLFICDDDYYESIPSETFDNLFDERFKEILSIFKVGDFKWQQ